MENVAILDTETTGLDPSRGKVLEVAAILYNIPARTIICQASTLLHAEENPAYDINRISVDSLKRIPSKIENMGLLMITEIMAAADALIAHNAEFDKKWIETVIPLQNLSRNTKWICTRNDVKWPIRKGVALNLVHICVDLGVPIVNAHRALSDCHLLLNAIECIEDIDSFLDKSGKGRLIYHADVSYDQRQLAKDEGFMWDNLKKVWHNKLTPEEAAKMPFTVYPAEPSNQQQ